VPDGCVVSRVAVEHRGAYELVDGTGEITGALDAAARRATRTPFDYPTVGDWVVRSVEPRSDRRVAITAVLDRTSLLCRRAAGPRARPQLVAANADTLVVVVAPAPAGSGPPADPPASTASTVSDVGHRIEWYLTAAFSGGAQPVIVVNKIDTVSAAEHEATVDALRRRLGSAAAEVPILATSALDGRGLDSLGALAGDGATVALSGPSGVGKSSLVNRLAGAEVVPVAPLSPDGRGRHTTVRRQLVPVGGPDGGTFVDTPGLQDLIPWSGDLGAGISSRPPGTAGGLALTFPEIAELASGCRFADCAHAVEPDCAVRAAVQAGELAAQRLSTYLELVADMAGDRLSDESGPR
jgi:ribosome biogenesis GTPase